MNFLNLITNFGVERADSDQIGKRVLLANQISVISLFTGIPVILLYLFVIREYSIVVASIPLVAFFLSIPYLNRLGYVNFTRIAICIVIPIASFTLPIISSLFFKEDAIGINMYYVPRIVMLFGFCLPMILIDLNERYYLAMGITLPMIFLLIFDPVNEWLGIAISQVDHHYRYYSNMNVYFILGAVFLLNLFFYLQKANKRYEQEIINLNKSLDKRVKLQTLKLQEVNNDLNAFSFTVSHELKTSLVAAKLIAESLKEDVEVEKMKTLRSCLGEMHHLINDIMAYSRIGVIQKSKEPLNMNELVKKIIDECRIKDVSDKITWNVGELPNVFGDEKMIKVVMINLISNALKYSSESNKPMIEINADSKNDKIEFLVKDNGIGFDMKDHERLFTIFERLHSKSKYEGTGLGLAISKRIIEKHGGQIWAKGQPNAGAIFYFSLPITNS